MVADDLLSRVITGEFPAETPLPVETELGALHDVSRITVREAVKTLEAQHVLRVEQGRGTFVNPIGQWTSVDAVLRAASAATGDRTAAVQLIEVRRFLEDGAAELAASRMAPEQVRSLHDSLTRMRAAHEQDDVDGFVAADLAFHDIILRSAGNVFLPVVFAPLSRILAERRTETSGIPAIRAHAIEEHDRIADALASHDAERARTAMDRHITQTLLDFQRYLVVDD